MIIGAKYYNDRSRWHTQENNALEAMLKYILKKAGVVNPKYLESCGPTSAINCAKVVSNVNLNSINAGYPGLQPEDAVTMWMNNTQNRQKMMRILNIGTDPKPLNRVGQYFPVVMKEMYGIQCSYKRWQSTKNMLLGELRKGSALQICIDHGNHFVALVAYDDSKDVFIYNDSWQNRTGNKALIRGFNEKIGFDALLNQVPVAMRYYIAYGV